jgi:hypothetical protein
MALTFSSMGRILSRQPRRWLSASRSLLIGDAGPRGQRGGMKRIAVAFAVAEILVAVGLVLAGLNELVPVAITLALWLAAWSAAPEDQQ